MPRPKQYPSVAARQAAYRQRLAATTAVVDRVALERLHEQLQQLQQVIADAAQHGDPLACQCRAGAVDTMLEKLITAFARKTPSAQATTCPSKRV